MLWRPGSTRLISSQPPFAGDNLHSGAGRQLKGDDGRNASFAGKESGGKGRDIAKCSSRWVSWGQRSNRSPVASTIETEGMPGRHTELSWIIERAFFLRIYVTGIWRSVPTNASNST